MQAAITIAHCGRGRRSGVGWVQTGWIPEVGENRTVSSSDELCWMMSSSAGNDAMIAATSTTSCSAVTRCSAYGLIVSSKPISSWRGMREVIISLGCRMEA